MGSAGQGEFPFGEGNRSHHSPMPVHAPALPSKSLLQSQSPALLECQYHPSTAPLWLSLVSLQPPYASPSITHFIAHWSQYSAIISHPRPSTAVLISYSSQCSMLGPVLVPVQLIMAHTSPSPSYYVSHWSQSIPLCLALVPVPPTPALPYCRRTEPRPSPPPAGT